MLTADLLLSRVRAGRVLPRYLPREGPEGEAAQERAATLIGLYEAHLDRRRAELDEALKDLVAGRPDFKVDRGLAKLLDDRSEWRGLHHEEAARRRLEVFQAAARERRAARAAGRSFDRAGVLSASAQVLEVPSSELEESLYADLKRNEILLETKPITPEALLDRYNLALAQAVLLRALGLEVRVREADPPRLRALLRHVKFQGLLQEARREEEGEVVLRLDGPLSIFSATPRYGVKMAGFLPALVHCQDWSLEATVQLGKRRHHRRFTLGPEDGLRSHTRDVGAWLPELVEAFAGRFAEVTDAWTCDRQVPLLNLGGEVVVPDFRFVHHESGCEAWMEVLGYWRRGGVQRRLAALRAHGAPRLILALDQSLKLDKGVKDLEGPLLPFRDVPSARKVVRCLEALRAQA